MRSGALLAVVLVAATLAVPVGAHERPDDSAYDPSTDIRVSYDVRLVGEPTAFLVTATVDLPSSVQQFDFRPPAGAEIVSADGFEATSDGYTWSDDVESPTITYRLDAEDPATQGNVAIEDGWAVFRKSAVAGATQWLYTGDEPAIVHRVRPSDDGPGEVGEAIVLLGTHETVDGAGAAAPFRLQIPDGADLRAEPAAVFDSLAFARRNLDVGHRHEHVTGMVFSRRLRTLGFAPRGLPELAVHEAERPRGAANVWIHEYVHTRQHFTTTPELAWLVEGSAEYEAALLTMQHGNATWAEFRDAATTERYAEADLSRPVSGLAPLSHYEKGAAVVAAIDAEIRRATDGDRDFEAVLRRLNDREGEISTGEFELVVERVAGESLDREIDEMITGEYAGTEPTDPFVYTAGPEADADGDGLTTDEERAAGSNPFEVDTDGDGLEDLAEVETHGSDPATRDTDADLLGDATEIRQHGTDPTSVDTDGDGLPDDAEVRDHGTDPTEPDTDGDGVTDGREVERGTDPTVATGETTTGQRDDATGTDIEPTATAVTTATGTRTDGAANPVVLGPVMVAALLAGIGLRLASRR